MTDPISLTPIGVIRTPFADIDGVPIQPTAGAGITGRVELDPAFELGLTDLDGFSHLTLIYHLHLVTRARLLVTPFLDTAEHGIFATRSPARPNALGLSTVRLTGVSGTTLLIEDVDMVDGTPLLDIKPHVPAIDARDDVRIGWYASRIDDLPRARADGRFR